MTNPGEPKSKFKERLQLFLSVYKPDQLKNIDYLSDHYFENQDLMDADFSEFFGATMADVIPLLQNPSVLKSIQHTFMTPEGDAAYLPNYWFLPTSRRLCLQFLKCFQTFWCVIFCVALPLFGVAVAGMLLQQNPYNVEGVVTETQCQVIRSTLIRGITFDCEVVASFSNQDGAAIAGVVTLEYITPSEATSKCEKYQPGVDFLCYRAETSSGLMIFDTYPVRKVNVHQVIGVGVVMILSFLVILFVSCVDFRNTWYRNVQQRDLAHRTLQEMH
eukprot:c46042_g1_i1.p1 GENE.c46042_g1_i1~~c46042_g1_i1.p1  ORF type:complete len:274 (-),score=42.59 c46042_g1_i1:57-878(-)